MAVFTTILPADLKKPVEVKALEGVLFTGDAAANVICAEVLDGGSPASLSGAVKGYVILPDRSTLPAITGTLSGNRASITLPADAYVLDGPVDIVIKLESGTGSGAVRTTLAACRAQVRRTTTATTYDPGGVTPSVSDLEYWIGQCQTASGEASDAAAALNSMDAVAASLAADADPTAQISTVDGHYRISLGIPVGVPPEFSIGTVQSGQTATVTLTGTLTNPVLNFTLPKGDKGDKGNKGDTGNDGVTPSFSIGTVTKGDAASATITGTAANPVLNLVLPKGDPGAAGTPGATGATPQFSIGTVTTGATGSAAAATITGTAANPVLNLTLPKGDPGDVSSVNGVSPDANGNVQLSMADISTGTVPVSKGGTGATTAAGARTNLGTVNIEGDTMTGALAAPDLSAQGGSYPSLYIRDASGNTCVRFVQSASAAGRLRIREMTAPGQNSVYEDYYLPAPTIESGSTSYDILTSKAAVTVAQGGTGAATAAGARTNLGITPANINAVAKGGDTMTGNLAIAASGSPMFSLRKTGDSFPASAYLTNVDTGQTGFILRNRDNPNASNVYEAFYLPAPDDNRTGAASYDIFTSKDPEGVRTAISAAKYGSIAGGTRANSYTTPGLYYVGATTTDLPAGTNGFLLVMSNSNGTLVKQLYSRMGTVGTNDHQTYIRTLSSGTWGDWYRVITDKNPTFSTYATIDMTTSPHINLQYNGSAMSSFWADNSNSRALIRSYHLNNQDYYENYYFPQPDAAATGNKTYYVLTTKEYNVKEKTASVNSSIAAASQLYVYTTALTGYTCIAAWFEISSNSNVLIVSQPVLATNSQVLARIYNPGTAAVTATGTMHFVFVPTAVISAAS